MNVQQLIDELKKCDPTDEVSVGNADILCVYAEPAYWDGRLQRLVRDANGRIIGGKYTSKGSKIVIRPQSIHDAIDNNPDLPIDYSDIGNPDTAERYKQSDDEYRLWVKEIIKKVEDEIAAKKAQEKNPTTV